eukprot:s2047_g10.t1
MVCDPELAEKHRFQDANARVQQLLISLKLAGEATARAPSGEASPEGRHPLPQHHHDWKQMGWRGKIVVFLHWKHVHYCISGLIVLDALLVMATLQMQMEVFALDSLSKTDCLQLFFSNTSSVDSRCVVEHPHHVAAEHLEQAEHILGYTSIVILGIFLVENTLKMVAFGRNFAKVLFYPLDLLVVVLSIGSEILSFTITDDPRLEAAEEMLEPSTLTNRGSIAKDVGGAAHVVGVIIFARFWRFFRVGHAVYFIESEEDSEKRLETDAQKQMKADAGESSSHVVLDV